MPWTKRGKIFCINYLETKSFETIQAKFRGKFNFNNYPQKSQIYRWVHKFQATDPENHLNKGAESPWSDSKLTARCPDTVDVVRDSVGRSPKAVPIQIRRCPWCNCYRRRKWTRRHEFKSWTKLIAFHIALIPLGKVWIQLFSLQLWVNSRTD